MENQANISFRGTLPTIHIRYVCTRNYDYGQIRTIEYASTMFVIRVCVCMCVRVIVSWNMNKKLCNKQRFMHPLSIYHACSKRINSLPFHRSFGLCRNIQIGDNTFLLYVYSISFQARSLNKCTHTSAGQHSTHSIHPYIPFVVLNVSTFHNKSVLLEHIFIYSPFSFISNNNKYVCAASDRICVSSRLAEPNRNGGLHWNIFPSRLQCIRSTEKSGLWMSPSECGPLEMVGSLARQT